MDKFDLYNILGNTYYYYQLKAMNLEVYNYYGIKELFDKKLGYAIYKYENGVNISNSIYGVIGGKLVKDNYVVYVDDNAKKIIVYPSTKKCGILFNDGQNITPIIYENQVVRDFVFKQYNEYFEKIKLINEKSDENIDVKQKSMMVM